MPSRSDMRRRRRAQRDTAPSPRWREKRRRPKRDRTSSQLLRVDGDVRLDAILQYDTDLLRRTRDVALGQLEPATERVTLPAYHDRAIRSAARGLPREPNVVARPYQHRDHAYGQRCGK